MSENPKPNPKPLVAARQLVLDEAAHSTMKMSSTEALMLWDCLFTVQREKKISGNLLEIGVALGGSAQILALHARREERLLLVDIALADRYDRAMETIARARPLDEISPEFFKKKSEAFNNDIRSGMEKSFRWVHIDGGHSGQVVMNDLVIAERLSNSDGIICLDDFFSNRYPQITKAFFDFIHSNPFRLVPLLIGWNKAYACRPSMHRFWMDYVGDCLLGDLDERGLVRCS